MRTAIVSFLFVLLISVSGYCADVTLSWNAQPGMTGYRVYQSTVVEDRCGVWDNGTDVGAALSYSATNINDGTYFAVGAYQDQGEKVSLWSEAFFFDSSLTIKNFGIEELKNNTE